MLSIIDGFQVRVNWMNQSEVISGRPNFQFHLSQEVAVDDLEKSFFIQPETEGTWQWMEDDLVTWSPDSYLDPGQMIHFGFNQEKSSDENIKSIQWQVFIRQPEIIYLKSVAEGKEIFSLSAESPEIVKQLTQTNGMIDNFTVSPDGEQILFTQTNTDLGIDFWIMNRNGENPTLVLNCEMDRCTNPAWNPVRDEIVFTIEKHRTVNQNQSWDIPTPYTLNLVSGIIEPVLKDSSSTGYDPTWSARGQWVTYWQGPDRGIQIVHAVSKNPVFQDPTSDDTGCWSPDERYFYYSNVREEGLPIVSTIYQVEILSTKRDFFTRGELFDLGFNYYYPVCHPKGDGLMAVVQIDPKIPYRELWWIKPDNSYSKIYSDLTMMVTQFVWSPNGIQGIFLRDTLLGLVDGSEIVLWDVNHPEPKTFEDHVFKIQWLP
jgi:WD40 repeat protein